MAGIFSVPIAIGTEKGKETFKQECLDFLKTFVVDPMAIGYNEKYFLSDGLTKGVLRDLC